MNTPETPFVCNRNRDFISRDTADLAMHMHHCRLTRSRFFDAHAVLELAHSVIFSRLVTASLLAAMLALGAAIF